MVSPHTESYETIFKDYRREGTNALDAAFVAYSSISALRQQIKPDHRVHGVVHGKHWQPNGKFYLIFFFLLNKSLSYFSDPGLCHDAVVGASPDILRAKGTRRTSAKLFKVNDQQL